MSPIRHPVETPSKVSTVLRSEVLCGVVQCGVVQGSVGLERAVQSKAGQRIACHTGRGG